MTSCRNRQTLISLVSGTYNSVRSAVTAHQFLSDVTMGRAVEVDAQLDEFQLDPVLMDLILDNAMANATKHGDPRGPNVRITVKGGPDGSTVSQVTNMSWGSAVRGAAAAGGRPIPRGQPLRWPTAQPTAQSWTPSCGTAVRRW